MNAEKLTAEQSLKIYKIRASATGNTVSPDEADGFIVGYRAAMEEVDQQTKQLKEERDQAAELLKQFVRGDIKGLLLPSEKRVINEFLDQLMQNNER